MHFANFSANDLVIYKVKLQSLSYSDRFDMCMRRNNKYIHNFDAESNRKPSFTRPAKWGDILKFE